MKRLLSVFLSAVFFFFAALPAGAADDSIARAVIGGDLTEEQILSVYQTFQLPRGAVTELTMTNELERKYLESFVDSSVIGTRSVSCVYMELAPAGSGIHVTTSSNISYFTPEMYASALTTAGITDVNIVVDAPFEVSGTGALAGIYYAYEDIRGMTMDEMARNVSGQEFSVTGELADTIGSSDATDIVSDIKDVLGVTEDMTDDQLRELIIGITSQYNVALSNKQIDQLISLCRSLLSLDEAGLLEKVQEMQGTISRVSSIASKIASIFRAIKNGVLAVIDFFGRIKALFA